MKSRIHYHADPEKTVTPEETCPPARDAVLMIRMLDPEEEPFLYTQPAGLLRLSGCIGHLRGYLDSEGNGFHASWEDHTKEWNTKEFQEAFDEIVKMLRFDSDIMENVLLNRSRLVSFCLNSGYELTSDESVCGFRIDFGKYAYMVRLDPRQGEYNFYIYAYRYDLLNRQLDSAMDGIRFTDPDSRELFRIPDGGKLKITDAGGSEKEFLCRYYDEQHLYVGSTLYHTLEFAEKMADSGCSIAPVVPPFHSEPEQEAAYAGFDR